MSESIRSITVVGGGTAGWMSASLLADTLSPHCAVTLVESEEIGIIGVGEASVPILKLFNDLLGIDEKDFIAATQGSFKLGIEFCDWGVPGNVHFHGFGGYGDAIRGVSPHHYWWRLRASGDRTPIDEYSFPYALARRGKFAPADPAGAQYLYAFHFDAVLYARFLREFALGKGVTRIEGKVVDVVLDGETGFIDSLQLADGRSVGGDLFIDCTGFASLLVGGALKTPFVDWSHWLLADSAMAVPSASDEMPMPFTRSTAREAGWQWRIPLQNRHGNGLVYSSRFLSDDAARDVLLSNLPGAPLGEPRMFRFVSGHRKQFWNRNCVAIGFAGSFLEPLESTGIQLIQTGIARLLEYLPDQSFDPRIRDEYNRITTGELKRIRDFIIAHYHLTGRDEPFWAACRSMDVPDSLKHKLEVWRACAYVALSGEESYQEPSWAAILLGNGFVPERCSPLANHMPLEAVRSGMAARRAELARAAAAMPSHAAYLEKHCKGMKA